MVSFELIPVPAEKQDSGAFIGGCPMLPANSDWPKCRICSDDLVHFFDVTLPAGPFKSGSRLQVFACREHDDIAGTIYSDYTRFDSVRRLRKLPEKYWDTNDGHYLIRLLPPQTEQIPSQRTENRLALFNLNRRQQSETENHPSYSFKLFGYPTWAQYPEEHLCCCGAEMRFLLQLPDGFGFDMVPGAPEQPNSFSHKKYCLFLGNELYLLACEKQCHPLALLPVLQHS